MASLFGVRPMRFSISFLQQHRYASTVKDYLFDKTKEYQKTNIREPSKLLMVWKVKELKGRPHWERDVMKRLGLDPKPREETSKIAIVKNTPGMCELLMKVKHLVRIKPILFPNGLPSEEDLEQGATYLKHNGEFVVSPKLKVDAHRFAQDPKKEKVKMDGQTLEKYHRQLWHI